MIAALEDFELDDRARALVSIATKYDELHTVLTGADRWMNDERAEQALVAMIRPFAHPLLDAAALTDLLSELRNACTARSTYEVYGFFPDHIEEKIGETYSQSQADELLDDDVDAALFPLLTASTMPCHECRRIKCDVTGWEVATYGMRCESHRLVAVDDGFGIGLVAS